MSESKTSRSRAWNFPTSPRSPYKLQGELQLLKAFDGRVWDKNTQLEFAKSLANYESVGAFIGGCFIAIIALALGILLSPVFWLAVIAIVLINGS